MQVNGAAKDIMQVKQIQILLEEFWPRLSRSPTDNSIRKMIRLQSNFTIHPGTKTLWVKTSRNNKQETVLQRLHTLELSDTKYKKEMTILNVLRNRRKFEDMNKNKKLKKLNIFAKELLETFKNSRSHKHTDWN